MNYNEGIFVKLFTVEGNERVLGDNTFLISETDSKGVIVFANDDFCKVAGYDVNELMGKPHNIIRHPDMPKAAFKDLWETIKKGGIWTGYVKNSFKGGSQFYWVYATVFPVDRDGARHYISCRRKATSDEIQKYDALYKSMTDKGK